MITIISGTNRTGNKTRQIVFYYRDALRDLGEEPEVLLPEGINLNKRSAALQKIEEEILIPSEKFIFILPEYNGSFPGAIKTLIDLCQVGS